MRLLAVYLTLGFFAHMTLAAEALKDVFGRMDTSAQEFRGLTAKMKKTTYTAVLKDTSEEQGAMALKMSKSRETQVRIDITSPDVKSWAFRGKKAELYVPKINTVQEYDLGKHARLLDQFLLLGFGTMSRDLEKSYSIKVAGEETVGSVKATKLELTPTSAQVQQHLKKVEIWLPTDSGTPIRQKFYQTSGDYVEVTYSEAKLETNLPDSAVRLELPKNVKREILK